MNKFVKVILMAVIIATLSACGVSSEDHGAVVNQNTTLTSDLAKVRKELEDKKRDLAAEIKAKKNHAVREEQNKQRLKQAERDLASALQALRLCSHKK